VAIEIPASIDNCGVIVCCGTLHWNMSKEIRFMACYSQPLGYVAARSGMLKSPAIEEATKPLALLAQRSRRYLKIARQRLKLKRKIESARIGRS